MSDDLKSVYKNRTVTNNDNRVDKRVDNRVTYNVRTKDGKPAREYACEKTGAKFYQHYRHLSVRY